MKKKLLAVIIASVMVCGMLIGCGGSSSKNDPPAPAKTTDTGKEITDAAKESTDKSKQNIDAAKENANKSKEDVDTAKGSSNKSKDISNGEKKGTSASNNKQQVIRVPVTIINGTDVEFSELYASGVSVQNWGKNILDDGVTFGPGEGIRATFSVDANNLQWDFKAVDNYGYYLEFNGLDLSNCDSSGITITLRYNRATQTGTIIAE